MAPPNRGEVPTQPQLVAWEPAFLSACGRVLFLVPAFCQCLGNESGGAVKRLLPACSAAPASCKDAPKRFSSGEQCGAGSTLGLPWGGALINPGLCSSGGVAPVAPPPRPGATGWAGAAVWRTLALHTELSPWQPRWPPEHHQGPFLSAEAVESPEQRQVHPPTP